MPRHAYSDASPARLVRGARPVADCRPAAACRLLPAVRAAAACRDCHPQHYQEWAIFFICSTASILVPGVVYGFMLQQFQTGLQSKKQE